MCFTAEEYFSSPLKVEPVRATLLFHSFACFRCLLPKSSWLDSFWHETKQGHNEFYTYVPHRSVFTRSCSSLMLKQFHQISVRMRDNKLVHKQTNLSYKRVSRLCKSLGNNSNMVLNKIALPISKSCFCVVLLIKPFSVALLARCNAENLLAKGFLDLLPRGIVKFSIHPHVFLVLTALSQVGSSTLFGELIFKIEQWASLAPSQGNRQISFLVTRIRKNDKEFSTRTTSEFFRIIIEQ